MFYELEKIYKINGEGGKNKLKFYLFIFYIYIMGIEIIIWNLFGGVFNVILR